MSADMQHDSTLEAGLLRKQHHEQEEEKSQLSGRGFGDRTTGYPDSRPVKQENNPRKMSTLRRFLVIAFVGLVALMGLAVASGPCLGAMKQHRGIQVEKRQAPGSNTTSAPAGQGSQQQGGKCLIHSQFVVAGVYTSQPYCPLTPILDQS